MPIGTPSVPYRLPGSQYERWVDIYTRMSYLNPQEALDYGVIDRILSSQKDLPNKI